MTSRSIADRLSAARRQKLVGREAEIALFRAALHSGETDEADETATAAAGAAPFCVLHVWGPGGVGKTTLLGAFAHECRALNVGVTFLDGRNIEPSPDSFLTALRQAQQAASEGNGSDAAANGSGRSVLFVDTYETLETLDDWLRETFVPGLPGDVLVVLAGRGAPSPGWRQDLGWQSMVRTIALRNLSPDESRTFLRQRSVPAGEYPAVLDFTHGHPLALSLVADLFDQLPASAGTGNADGAPPFSPEAAPDVVQALLERFVRDVPGPLHRRALESCALARLTTEDLLAHLLDVDENEARGLFDWLRALSFVEAGRRGVFPHDLARDALLADLRWRNPDRYDQLHERARTYYAARHQAAAGSEQQRILFDFMFLHRDSQVVRTAFAWHDDGSANLVADDVLRANDADALVAMTEKHEGDESAALLRHWLGCQPENVLLFRDAQTGVPAGFVFLLALEAATPAQRDRDPAARRAWEFLENNNAAPLRPGEKALHFRFWMADNTYQDVSPVQSLIIVNLVRRCLTISGLAYTFFPVADPDTWEPFLAYAEMHRVPPAEFAVEERTFGVFGNDWRVLSPPDWLARLAQKETAGDRPLAPPERGETLLVLSEPEFAEAVRNALRYLGEDAALRTNPLLRSRLVAGQGASAAAGERLTALRSVLRETAELLQGAPRTARGYQALLHTYLTPAPSQEEAADRLDLPFSTYRRHLAEGIGELTRLLWQREIGT